MALINSELTLKIFLLLAFFFPGLGQASDLNNFKNWQLSNLSEKNLTRHDLFKSMNRDLPRLDDSICSNRAQLWSYDFLRLNQLATAKVFLFYTRESGSYGGGPTWWYHVAPVVKDNDGLHVLDAGFPDALDRTVGIPEWLKGFTGSTNCHEILAHEKELVDLIGKGQAFPETTKYGKFDCYYVVAPAPLWTPASVHRALNSNLEAPFEFDLQEVSEACEEAASSRAGSGMGSGRRKCRAYLGF